MSKFIIFFSVIAILYEFLSFLMPVKFNNFSKGLKEKLPEEMTPRERSFINLNLYYHLWSFVGLFTSEWLLFIILIIVNITLNFRVSLIRFIRSFISLVILLFILINCYHLHINVYQLILSTISNY